MKYAALAAVIFSGALPAATLEGFAVLEAGTLMPGPVSGQFIAAVKDTSPPYGGQPAQGFSAIIPNDDGTYLVLSDNGYGSRENSADFLLRIYCISPDFRTGPDGRGLITIEGYINLGDPAHRDPYPLNGRLPDQVLSDRLLSGADFDPESFQRANDGTLWVGDEFGPFLLHFSPNGELLEAPYSLAGLVSESHPGLLASGAGRNDKKVQAATLRRSRGFEGMALAPSGKVLYPMLEGSLFGQPGQLNIYTFDLETREFRNASGFDPTYRYRPEPAASAVSAFQLFSETEGLVLERDSGQADAARHKKIYRVHFGEVDNDGFLVKQEVADLLDILDPLDLDGDGQTRFSFPFQTPESLLIVDGDTVGIINDNNYPFGRGRGEASGPEPTEFVLITIADLW